MLQSDEKHTPTPGPWEARGLTIWERGKTALSIATVNQHHPNARTNASKIAAVQDLIAALEGVLRVADRKTDEFDAARAALAKVRGEQ